MLPRIPRALSGVLSTGLLLGLVVAPSASAEIGPNPTGPETVTAAPRPTWQTNGTVWDMEIVNGVVYVAGSFTSVRPPGAAAGTGEVPRSRLAAFDAVTGDLLPWAPVATASPWTPPAGSTIDPTCTPLAGGQIECATVWSMAVTPDKSTLILGGDFGFINGSYQQGLAALTVPAAKTGQSTLLAGFRPTTDGRVYSVAATNTTVYAGGNFSKVGGVDRDSLASVQLPDGAVLPFASTITPGASTVTKRVRAIALTQDGSRLIVGGGFDKINDTTIHGLGAVDAVTGQTARFDARRIFSAAFVTSVNIFGDTVYSTADALGTTSEGVVAYNADTGAEVWYDGCKGASHSMTLLRGVVYVGSHSHDCGPMAGGFEEQYNGWPSGDRRRYTLRAEIPTGNGRAQLLQWFPRTNDGNGARAMANDGNTVWIGGEFTSVDNGNQQGLTRFSFLDSGGANHRPLTPLPVKVTSTQPGVIDIAFRETEDPDHQTLVYQLIRDGNTAAPIATFTSAGKPWAQAWISYQDKTVVPGRQYRYDVRAIDPMGAASNRSPSQYITAASAVAAAADLAKADGAVASYSFESRVNGRFVDSVSARTATPGSGVTTAAAPNPATGNGITLSGSSGGAVVDGLREWSTRAMTWEAMFRSTSTRGGVIASLGDSTSTTGVASNNVGNLYLDNSGRLNFGVQEVAPRTDPWAAPAVVRSSATTSGSYNNGTWYHVAATFDPGTGLTIYVNGEQVAQAPGFEYSRPVNAYLRIGGDRVNSWPNTPTSSWFNGSIDEVSLYRHTLSAQQIKFHADRMLGRLAAPFGLAASGVGPDRATLAWQPVPGATGYDVLQNGTVVGSTAATTLEVTGLTGSTTYQFTVRATAGAAVGPQSLPLGVTTAAPPPLPLLISGSTWKYSTSELEQSGWKSGGFDETGWSSGPSQLGYGEGDEATAVSPFGSDGVTRRMTTYFRTTVDLTDPAAVKSLAMRIKRDDGVVVHINGVEVYRNNMPAGAVTATTPATTYAGDDGQNWISATLPTAALVAGGNVVAVEIHQNVVTSNDMSFDMELTAIR